MTVQAPAMNIAMAITVINATLLGLLFGNMGLIYNPIMT